MHLLDLVEEVEGELLSLLVTLRHHRRYQREEGGQHRFYLLLQRSMVNKVQTLQLLRLPLLPKLNQNRLLP